MVWSSVNKQSEKTIAKYMTFLLLCWSPYIILFYPGGLWWDVYTQLWEWKGLYFEWTTHHPVFTTIVYGICMDLGQMINNANFSLFLHNIVLTSISIWVISYGVFYLGKMCRKERFSCFLLIFYGILPLWPMNFYCMSKDATYSVGVLMLTISLIRLIEEKGHLNRSQWIFLMIAIVLVDLCRANGVLLLVVSFVSLLFGFWKKPEMKKVAFCFMGVFIGCTVATQITCHFFGVKRGEIREILTVPLQQTARYMKYYGDDVTAEEREILEKYIDIDILASVYDPQMSDDVKVLFKEDADLGDVLDYIKAWGSMGLRHPGCYLKATWDNICGYINPFVPRYKSDYAQFDINGADSYIKDYNLGQSARLTKGRELLRTIANTVSELPVLGLLFKTGIYIWIWLGLAVIVIKNKKKHMMIPMLPAFMTWLVCLISPVNAYFRYILPMAVSMPILLTWIVVRFFTDKRNKGEKHGVE